MKPAFVPGISDEMTITTTPEMGITHLGPDVPSMYSTPSMVQLIEGTCVRLISRYVEPGEQSVGFRVDVKHLAPTVVGKQVTSKVQLREVNGRRCIFDFEVHNEDGVKIGEGVHERAVIDVGRFAAAQNQQ
ncbi:MAG: hotdog domain-containing protein [Dehalococcoidia bacterium]